MSRLIDADTLRERLQNLAYDDWNQGITTSFSDACHEIIDIIEEQPTIEPEPHWIPVTERLPDKKAEVIYSLEPDIDKLIITIKRGRQDE